VLAVVALWLRIGQIPDLPPDKIPEQSLFSSEEADQRLADWKPTPVKEPDGAMGIQSKNLTLWQGPVVNKVRTLAFWIELNKGQQSIAWVTVKHPVWFGWISRLLSKDRPTTLHMPSGTANSGIYRLETPDVTLKTSTFQFSRPIKDEILTVLVTAEPKKTYCELSYTFAFDAPPTTENEADEAIQSALLEKGQTSNGCVTLREGIADSRMCSAPLQVGFSNPSEEKLRVLKVTLNEKDPIGHRCSDGQQ
jgi:hypothetical protein